MESSADVNNLPATADRLSGGESRSPQWLSSVSQLPLDDKVVHSFIARGKEQPFVCLAISNLLLMHLHVNNEDKVKHINMAESSQLTSHKKQINKTFRQICL